MNTFEMRTELLTAGFEDYKEVLKSSSDARIDLMCAMGGFGLRTRDEKIEFLVMHYKEFINALNDEEVSEEYSDWQKNKIAA
jgi:hypothetical protein